MAGYIPILPKSGLWLFHVDGNGPRFARIFADTWRRIPLWGRRRILKFWRDFRERMKAVGMPKGAHLPHIELIRDRSDAHKDAVKDRVMIVNGQARRWNGSLWFRSGAVDEASVEQVVSMIGHELAHIYLFATDPEHGEDPFESHVVVDEVMEAWGLDSELSSCAMLSLEIERERERSARRRARVGNP